MNTSQDNSQNDAKDSILARTPEQETRGSRSMAEHLGESPSSDTNHHRIHQCLRENQPEAMPCYLRRSCSSYDFNKCMDRDYVDNCRHRVHEELKRSYL
jgi:hypothetical protein